MLYDGPWPYPFKMLPLVKFPGMRVPGQLYDSSVVEQAIPLQKELNRTLSQMIEYKNLTLKPQMLAPVGSLRQRMTDEPGAIFEYNPVAGKVPEAIPLPGLPSYVFEHVQDLGQRIRDTFGLNEILQGDVPPNVEAGVAIDLLQEAATDRHAPQILMLEKSLERAGSVSAAQSLNRFNNTTRSNEIDGLRRVVNSFTPAAAAEANGTIASATLATANGKSGSLGKIDAYTSTYWDNQRTFGATPGTAEALTIMRVQQAINAGRQQGAMPSAIITSLGVQREFYRLLQANQQFVAPGATDYASGFSTLTYNGMPVIADLDAPYGKMYILDESTLKVFSDQDWHFLDGDGQTLRQVAGYDAYEAVMVRYMNMGATNRNKNVVINDINVNGSADAGV